MPVLKVIAGPNGSGKSTLIANLMSQGASFGEYLNADDIARNLTGSPESISLQAQEIVRERRATALAQKRDHAFETVMSHVSHIKYMRMARAAGFEVQLLFVGTEYPAINLDRVANRVERGGHDVPRDRVIARYHRCLANLPAAILESRHAVIFDNSNRTRPLQRLAHIDTVYYEEESAVAQFLSYGERGYVDPSELPAWWLEILLRIKPENSFKSGLIDTSP